MNDGQTARLEGFRAQLAVDGVTLTILSAAGGTIFGLLSVNPPVEVPSELTEDRREKAILEVLRPAPAVVRADQLKDDDGNKWQIWTREDNAADFAVKFWLVKLVAGKDQ
ncbi:MAG: hypothetical protein JWQ04_2785 [Pedosphaera sp.]|nr:hypothetical protein [Pedosphaera sp.]